MTKSVFRGNTRFSVIVPTYNGRDELMECLKALSNQQVDKNCFEVVIVNDGGERLLADDLFFSGGQANVKYLHLERRCGPAAARNRGLRDASGDVILFLDDDSLPAENWLESMRRAWDETPDFDGIGGYVLKEPKDGVCCRVNSDLFNWYLKKHFSEGYSSFLNTCNASYKKGMLDRVSGFDENFKNASGEDRDLSIRIIAAGGKLRLDDTIGVYHDQGLSFWSFARKYFNYGRAARGLYLKHPGQRRLCVKDYVELYAATISEYPAKEKAIALLLLTVSQVSVVLGHLAAAVRGIL